MNHLLQDIHERQDVPSADNTIAVVVTYNPDDGLGQRVSRLQGQVARVVIVDNGSKCRVNELLHLEQVPYDIIQNQSNLGIAAALNQGLRRSIEIGAAWTLTLDQDSVPDYDMIERLSSIYKSYRLANLVGIVAANARSLGSGRPLVRCRNCSMDFVETKTVITSGNLLSNYAYKVTGAFCEDFFIEGVDLEYCLRLHKHRFRILLSCSPMMTHVTGKGQERKFLGRVLLVDNHAPWRYYYRTKNLISIVIRYFWAEPVWCLLAFVSQLKALVKIVLFEDNRRAKFKCVFMGLLDAFFRPKRVKLMQG